MFDRDTWNERNEEERKNITDGEISGTGSEMQSSQENQGTAQDQNDSSSQGGGQQPVQNYGQNYGQEYGQSDQSQSYGQPGQNYGQSGQGQPNQNYNYGSQGQNRYPYSNPYPYNYYQNSGTGQNVHQHGGGQNHSGGQQPRGPKKKSYLKTTALVTAAALLFGVVSGSTMFGVNRAAEILFPRTAETEAAAETEASLETTPRVEAETQTASGNTKTATGVVLEDVSPIVDAVMPSVVAITNTTLYKSNTWFGQTQTYEVPSSGSGIIVGQNDTELLVVTNNHVIEGANSLAVTFIDDTTIDAAVKGTDSDTDLAVIAIPLADISDDTKAQIKAATLGDSDSLKMGQGVIAIGNALGHGQSVTVGHVSALDREITVEGVTKKVIQTDAAINPGNSGGALLNSAGEVIGINEAKYANSNVEGIGYAIPVSQVKDIIDDLMNRTTKIEVAEEEQGYLGVQLQNIDTMTANLYGMPQGVFVYKIVEGSAAAESDLREKDIITKLDGEKVSSYSDLTELLTYYRIGDTVTLTVQSLQDGEYVEREVLVTLKEKPQNE